MPCPRDVLRYSHRGTHSTCSLRSKSSKEGRKEMFYLKTHSTQFAYGFMASDIW